MMKAVLHTSTLFASLGILGVLASCSSEHGGGMPEPIASGGVPATGGAPATGGSEAGLSSSSNPSCAGLLATCGPSGGDDCCASSLVPAGSFNRGNDPAYPATLSDFRLDRYEVTVGRFRKFVAAYSQAMLAAGAGKNPNDSSDPGWDAAWSASLPADPAALQAALLCNPTFPYETWTDTAGANENRPINCITWFEAFAFCVWDDGRLPTEAEWNYAAAGASEQRLYPWGAADPDCTYANWGGGNWPTTACVEAGPNDVGSESPKGDGLWGHSDLAGNLNERVLDFHADPYPQVPCVDCANTAPAELRVSRGGNFLFIAEALTTPSRARGVPENRSDAHGVRCARSP